MVLPARILVVDDEAIVCRSCQSVLAEEGHDVATAQTGEAALQKIEKTCFDVALLDLRIPGSGGLRLLRAIRDVSPRTEVIVMTGYPSIENAKESIRLGAFDYMAKPLVPQRLRSLVSEVLNCRPWSIQERC